MWRVTCNLCVLGTWSTSTWLSKRMSCRISLTSTVYVQWLLPQSWAQSNGNVQKLCHLKLFIYFYERTRAFAIYCQKWLYIILPTMRVQIKITIKNIHFGLTTIWYVIRRYFYSRFSMIFIYVPGFHPGSGIYLHRTRSHVIFGISTAYLLMSSSGRTHHGHIKSSKQFIWEEHKHKVLI